MEIDIKYQPSYSLAICKLNKDEAIIAEAGAMVSMDGNIKMETKVRGGLMQGLMRSVVGGESLFQNTYKAEGGPGEITLATSVPGDMAVQELNNNAIYIQSGAYVACGASVNLDTKWGGGKSFFGTGGGLFMLKASGTGPLIFGSFGAIHKVEIPAGKTYLVDTGHLVAFSSEIGDNGRFKVVTRGGVAGAFLSGEGFIAEYQGPGTVWLQTRQIPAMASMIAPYISKS